MFDYIASLKEPDITEELESLSTEDSKRIMPI